MHRHDVNCFVHTFPLFRSMPYYAYHACLCHLLAFYASLHACLHVHAWVLLASVLSILQHNEAMDIRSKPTFVPRGHHLLFAFLLVCLLLCLFAFSFVCSHPCFYACHVYHAYLLYSSFIHSLHIFLPLLVCWFLVFVFACTHMERGCMELGNGLLGASKEAKKKVNNQRENKQESKQKVVSVRINIGLDRMSIASLCWSMDDTLASKTHAWTCKQACKDA